jgi:hypothetical protein
MEVMDFKNTPKGKIELETAIARVKATATVLATPLTDLEKFKILWKLAFVHLQDLEDYRRVL